MNQYKQGFTDGLRQARKLVKEDIAAVYGMLSVILIESGNSEDDVQNLLAQIQDRWITVTQSGQSVKEYLSEHLPFEIYQDII